MVEGKPPAWQETIGGFEGFDSPGFCQLVTGHVGAKCKVPDALLLQSPNAKRCPLFSRAQVTLCLQQPGRHCLSFRKGDASFSLFILGRQAM